MMPQGEPNLINNRNVSERKNENPKSCPIAREAPSTQRSAGPGHPHPQAGGKAFHHVAAARGNRDGGAHNRDSSAALLVAARSIAAGARRLRLADSHQRQRSRSPGATLRQTAIACSQAQ